MKKRKPDYKKYKLKKAEYILVGGKWFLIDGLISYLFYHSWIAFCIGLCFFPLYLRWERQQRKKKRLQLLTLQFKESMQCVLSGLEAGYSLENAFVAAYEELCQIYQSRNDIIHEFQIIKTGLSMNEGLEQLLIDFAVRCQLEDVKCFAELITIAKRRGSNLADLIRSSIMVIQEKMEVYQEIDTILSGRKMEQRIMVMMPVAILIYVNFASPGFFDVMYQSFMGILIMTGCLLLYVLSVCIGIWIVNIEV